MEGVWWWWRWWFDLAVFEQMERFYTAVPPTSSAMIFGIYGGYLPKRISPSSLDGERFSESWPWQPKHIHS